MWQCQYCHREPTRSRWLLIPAHCCSLTSLCKSFLSNKYRYEIIRRRRRRRRRGARWLVDNELNEHCPPQREVLFAYLNFSLSPHHPQREVLVDLLTTSSTSTTPLKEKFSLPIWIFPCLLSHRQREVLIDSLTLPPSKRSSVCLFEFFPVACPILNERCLLTLWQRAEREVFPSKRSSLCVLNFSLSPPPPSRRDVSWLVDKELNEQCSLTRWQIKEKSSRVGAPNRL